jgi:hypothetical protein
MTPPTKTEDEGLVERGARAICACDEQDGAGPWDYHTPKYQEGYRERARAAQAELAARITSLEGELEEARKLAETQRDAFRAEDRKLWFALGDDVRGNAAYVLDGVRWMVNDRAEQRQRAQAAESTLSTFKQRASAEEMARVINGGRWSTTRDLASALHAKLFPSEK